MGKNKEPKYLFVFHDFAKDWSGGLAVALASSKKEAKSLIQAKFEDKITDWGTLTKHRFETPVAFAVQGGQ